MTQGTKNMMEVISPYRACLFSAFTILFLAEGHAAGHSEIYGDWQADHTPCGQISDDRWSIDRTGVTSFETSCTILSMKKGGNKYTFEQRCDVGMGEEEIAYTTDVVEILSRNRARINGSLYNRCPAP